MYAVLKNTLLVGSATALFSVITFSGSKTGRLLPEQQGKEAINPFIKVMPSDTPPPETEEPPVTNDDLHYPIKENGYDEPVYNANNPLQLNNPSNIKTSTTYNPDDSSYTFTQKMGDIDYRTPTYMTQEEYQDYKFRQLVKSYWKSRIQADSKSDPKKKQLIPTLKVNSELFDRLFGGNNVDIRPTGSAELDLGVITNRNQNPAIPVKQRKISNFNFNMKIQMNLVGNIGTKLKLTMNYNTEASFDFENQVKIQWAGDENDILKKVEAGNVSLPLNSALIQGSQTLFGVKTTMQFGKLTVSALAAQQRGKKTELNIQNGAQTQTYTVQADNYEANRHYFLGQWFRDNYSGWLSNAPIVSSPIQITKIEVWITNKTAQFDQARNVAGFADLGEEISHVYQPNTNTGNPLFNIQDSSATVSKNPRNTITNLYKMLIDSTNPLTPLYTRDYNTAVSRLSDIQGTNGNVFNPGREFEVLTRARRLTTGTDYILNARLGYISLNTALNYDEVLMVSYQYTLNGKVYQVGEFSDQYPSTNQLLVMKLLKSTQVNLQIPMWDLMMKNVYSVGAYSLSQTNFMLQVYYNNIKTGVDVPYIPYGSMNGHLLIQEMDLDRINQNQDAYPDGNFDFIPNVTVNTQNGRIYFTHPEPFGSDLLAKFTPDERANHYADIQNYIFQELYDSTKVSAQQLPNKDRYKLKGSYQSATSNEFSLNAMNIPQGSVKVTAGGVPLTENVDFTVDYNLGRVKIINESVLNSGQAIKITAENNSLFNVQQKSMQGARFDYKHSKNLTLGGTLLHYGERPLTQKVNIGDEPVSNTMLGIDGNYTANAPWLTRLVDRIPLIQTKEPSSINVSGEAADLIAGHAKAIGSNGGTSYIDDFEGSISTIDLRSATAWFHAAIPQNQPFLFPETSTSFSDTLRWGKNRGKLAWYNVDQSVFYQQSSGITPSQVTTVVQSNHFMEPFFESDLFPKKTPPNNQPQLLPMLDLAYYPEERGPYNFDVKPTAFSAGVDVSKSNDAGHIVLKKPETRWAGITRALTTNDFQASNIEYIQFWMMDPFNEDYNNQSQSQYNTFHQNPPTNGELYFNLGNISEDILKDGAMSYENGIPVTSGTDTSLMQYSVWGRTPSTPPLVNAFDVNESSRPIQDVGYDCYKDDDEKVFYKDYTTLLTNSGVTNSTAFNDPSGDNYHFYRGDDYDNLSSSSTVVANTLFRYKEYNNVEGNSPTPSMYQSQNQNGYSTVGNTSPNIEDVNRDNTLNQAESYYQYKIKITPQDINENNVGNNYIVNVVPVTKAGPDGVQRTVNFYQFKIPITNYDAKIGAISGYNSIRFMRMFVKSFSAPVVMRFARLELIRSDWRNYQEDLSTPTGGLITNQQTTFVSSGVSYQENGTRTPINYVLPPGINQQQNVQTTNLVLLNEQSISMQVDNLKDGDARAIYKNISNDFRSYKKIRMFVHAEKLDNKPLNNGDVHLFVRIGSDFTNNYYVYEVPLKLTAPGTYDNANDDDRNKVWLSDNEVVINLEEIEDLKLKRNADIGGGSISTAPYYTVTTSETGVSHTIGVVGNPNMGAVTSVMVGILNPITPANPKAMSAEVWVDELRVTDFNQHGGQAVVGHITAKLADFGQLAFSGQYATPWFGSIDAKPTDRSRNTTRQYNVSGTFQLAKFLPKDWKVNLPFYFQQGVTDNVPLFDPTNGDIYMSQINTKNNYFNENEVSNIKKRAIDHTLQQGYNFTNVSKQRGKNKTKSFPWDIENFSVTYAYTRIYKSNVNLDHSENRNYNGLLSYNYQMQLKAIEPFKKSTSKLIQSPWLAILKEMSIKPLPTQFQFSDNVTRTYLETKARDISSEQYSDPLLTQTQYNKTFNTTRNYATKWDLTKNIKLDYTAVNIGRVLELHDTGRNVTSEEKNLAAKNLLIKGGTNTSYQQTTNANILLPLNKIPALDFITQASVKYAGNYQWIRRPFAVDTVGNTIQNTQTQGYTAQLNMVNLYNKIPYLKRLNQNLPKPKKDAKKDDKKKNDKKKKGAKGSMKDPKSMIPGQDQPPDNKQGNGQGQQEKPDSTKKKDDNPFEIFDHLARILMTVKQIQGNYNITQGTTLPGFEPSTSVLGMSNNAGSVGAPGFGFVFGGNQGKMPGFEDGLTSVLTPTSGVVYDAEHHNWLVHRQNFSTQYLHTKTQTLTYNANIEPFKNFKITLSGNMTHAQTESYFIGYDTAYDYNNHYKHYTPVFGGSYNVSIISIGTAFSTTLKDGSYDNSNFERYIHLRQQYSSELADQQTKKDPTYQKGSLENGYFNGYNLNQQDVVINSFIQAYTSKSTKAGKVSKNPFSRVPLPGWNITYDGLGKLAIAKKLFKSIVLTHGYHSTLSYGNYTNNQAYTPDGKARASDSSGNFISPYLINSVNITESFSPLIKVNVMFVDKGKMKGLGANFEIKRDRSVSLASNVPQIMELNSSEYNIGLNYTLPQLEIKKLQIKGKPLKSDLMATVTLSFRKTQSVLRQAVDQIESGNDVMTQLNRVSNGQNITTIKVSLSYALTQNINLRVYYDRTINKPVISTSFPTSVTNCGVSLRFAIQ